MLPEVACLELAAGARSRLSPLGTCAATPAVVVLSPPHRSRARGGPGGIGPEGLSMPSD